MKRFHFLLPVLFFLAGIISITGCARKRIPVPVGTNGLGITDLDELNTVIVDYLNTTTPARKFKKTVLGVNCSFGSRLRFQAHQEYLKEWVEDLGVKVIAIPSVMGEYWWYSNANGSELSLNNDIADIDFNAAYAVLAGTNTCLNEFLEFIDAIHCQPFFVIQQMPIYFAKDIAANFPFRNQMKNQITKIEINNSTRSVVPLLQKGNTTYCVLLNNIYDTFLTYPPKSYAPTYGPVVRDFFRQFNFQILKSTFFKNSTNNTIYYDFGREHGTKIGFNTVVWSTDTRTAQIKQGNYTTWDALVSTSGPFGLTEVEVSSMQTKVHTFIHEEWNDSTVEDSVFEFYIHITSGLNLGYQDWLEYKRINQITQDKKYLVGGIATADIWVGSNGINFTGDFIKSCSSNTLKLDFVSLHSYGDQLDSTYSYTQTYVENMAKAKGYENIKIINSECGPNNLDDDTLPQIKITHGKHGACWAMEFFKRSNFTLGNILAFGDTGTITPQPWNYSDEPISYSWDRNSIHGYSDNLPYRYIKKSLYNGLLILNLTKNATELALNNPPSLKSHYSALKDSSNLYFLTWNYNYDTFASTNLYNNSRFKENIYFKLENIPQELLDNKCLYCQQFLINDTYSNAYNYTNQGITAEAHQDLECVPIKLYPNSPENKYIVKLETIAQNRYILLKSTVNFLLNDADVLFAVFSARPPNFRNNFEQVTIYITTHSAANYTAISSVTYSLLPGTTPLSAGTYRSNIIRLPLRNTGGGILYCTVKETPSWLRPLKKSVLINSSGHIPLAIDKKELIRALNQQTGTSLSGNIRLIAYELNNRTITIPVTVQFILR